MFIGHHTSTLDAKNRLAIPVHYQWLLNKGIYITQGFDRNLLLLTSDAFDEILHQIKQMNMADPSARLLFRMLLGSAAKLEFDKQGSIQVPAGLLEFAGIEKSVMLIGQGDFLELWAPRLWKEQEVSLNNVEANVNRFATLTICTGK
jgi:MraZ protein